MEKINHNFKKKFGQNFLTDNNIIVNTVSSVLLQEDDLVIEIGPGSGMLTKEILKKCRVLAYEIDTDLIDTLSNTLVFEYSRNKLVVIFNYDSENELVFNGEEIGENLGDYNTRILSDKDIILNKAENTIKLPALGAVLLYK